MHAHVKLEVKECFNFFFSKLNCLMHLNELFTLVKFELYTKEKGNVFHKWKKKKKKLFNHISEMHLCIDNITVGPIC